MKQWRSLDKNVEQWYKPGSGDNLITLFNALSLPIPEAGEYFKATPPVLGDPVYLTFMNDTGTVLRISNKHDYHGLRHNHIIEPLYTRIHGKVRLDILPGLECPADEETATQTADALWQDGIRFEDPKGRNVGTLPDAFPVVIDFDAVKALTFSVETLKRKCGMASKQKQEPGRQTRFYVPLSDAFTAAWPPGEPAKPETMQKAWTLCRDFKNKGVLKDSWNNPEVRRFYEDHNEAAYRGPRIPASAALYQRHIQRHRR